jgi:hypothetical protein
MLNRLTSTLDRLCENLEDSVCDFAANYARELLSAHGLIDLELEHIRSKMGVSEGDEPSQEQS